MKKSGETIVEVLVSAMIFLLLMGVLWSAVSFSSKAMDRSRKLRESYKEMLLNMKDTPVTSDGTAEYNFYAYDAEETTRGNMVYRVDAALGHKEVPYKDTAGNDVTAQFSVFDADDGGGTLP